MGGKLKVSVYNYTKTGYFDMKNHLKTLFFRRAARGIVQNVRLRRAISIFFQFTPAGGGGDRPPRNDDFQFPMPLGRGNFQMARTYVFFVNLRKIFII